MLIDFHGHALQEQVRSLAFVSNVLPCPDLPLLVFPELQLELLQLLAFLRIHLLAFLEMSDLDHKFLFVHLSLDFVKHGNWNVIDDFELLVYLWEHGNSYVRVIKFNYLFFILL